MFILQQINCFSNNGIEIEPPHPNIFLTPSDIKTDQEPEKIFLFLVYFEHHKVKVKPGDKETKKHKKHILPQLVWGMRCTITY